MNRVSSDDLVQSRRCSSIVDILVGIEILFHVVTFDQPVCCRAESHIL